MSIPKRPKHTLDRVSAGNDQQGLSEKQCDCSATTVLRMSGRSVMRRERQGSSQFTLAPSARTDTIVFIPLSRNPGLSRMPELYMLDVLLGA